jgi:hypothetical protein
MKWHRAKTPGQCGPASAPSSQRARAWHLPVCAAPQVHGRAGAAATEQRHTRATTSTTGQPQPCMSEWPAREGGTGRCCAAAGATAGDRCCGCGGSVGSMLPPATPLPGICKPMMAVSWLESGRRLAGQHAKIATGLGRAPRARCVPACFCRRVRTPTGPRDTTAQGRR